MFTRLLVGLDGSRAADVALDQAIDLGHRFRATLVLAHVRERGTEGTEAGALLERADARADAAGVAHESIERPGDPDVVLAELARDADGVLVGRRGRVTAGDALGPTVASLVRIAERCVIVCGSQVSPMRVCAVAFDGREASKRALDLAVRFAGITGSTVHVIHANDDPQEGLRIVGVAEAALSLGGVAFATHVESGPPGEVVAQVIRRTGCDALFAGAHVYRELPGRPSPVVVSHAEQILIHTDLPVVVQP